MNTRQATVKIITDVTAGGLEAALNAWLKGAGEEELISIQFTSHAAAVVDSADVITLSERFTAYIVYTK